MKYKYESKKHNLPKLVFTFFGLGMGAVASYVNAQELVLENIVVTAQKREEVAQETPISIGVVDGDTLSASAINTLDDALKTVTGVSVQGLAQGGQVYIRGVGSSIDPAFADPSVALMVDGVYNGRTEAVASGAYDIERIEVLRGPQGTLYGRNASGGSVNVITRNPVAGEQSAYLRVQAGNYSLARFEGGVNVPLGDHAALRVAGLRETRDGYVDDGSSDADTKSMRVKLLLEPSEGLSILAKYDYYRESGKGLNTVPIDGSAGNLSFPPPFMLDLSTAPPTPRFPNGWETADADDPWANNPEHVPGFIENESDSFSLQVDYDLDFSTLTLLPSYAENRNRLVSSFLFGSILPFTGPDYTINDNYNEQDVSTDYSSMEARLTSNGEGPLQYVLGLYYLKSDGDGATLENTADTTDGSTVLLYNLSEPAKTLAAFGQFTYDLTDALRVNLGLRKSVDDIGQSYYANVDGVDTDTESYSGSQDSVQYKLGLQFDIADHAMIYGHVATGFKQGGISPTYPPIGFKPEELTSYELGWKSQLLDRRMQLNVAAFVYDYENYQFSTFQSLPVGDSDTTATFTVIGNADQSTVKGVELELDYLIQEHTRVQLNFTYLDAVYGEAILPNNPFVNQGEYSLEDRQIQNSPDLTWSARIEQVIPTEIGEFRASLSTNYSDGYYTTPEQYQPGAYQDSFTRTDFNLGYRPVGGLDWELNLWARNIENDAQTTYVFPAYRRFITSPRTYGVSAAINF